MRAAFTNGDIHAQLFLCAAHCNFRPRMERAADDVAALQLSLSSAAVDQTQASGI